MKKFNLGDKFYSVRSGGLGGDLTIDVYTVESITETERGFRYNGDLRDHQMFTDAGKVKAQALELVEEHYQRNRDHINGMELEAL